MSHLQDVCNLQCYRLSVLPNARKRMTISILKNVFNIVGIRYALVPVFDPTCPL